MERLTIKTPKGVALKMDDTYPNEDAARADLMKKYRLAVDRLAAYEDTGLMPEDIDALQKREQGLAELLVNISCGCAVPYSRLAELAQAEKDGRLVALEPAAKEGAEKPPCFYNDMGQSFCLGFARGEYDDEPIDRCKECWYCESAREEAETALKKREEAGNETD